MKFLVGGERRQRLVVRILVTCLRPDMIRNVGRVVSEMHSLTMLISHYSLIEVLNKRHEDIVLRVAKGGLLVTLKLN